MVEKRKPKVFPWQVRAQINILEEAEAILETGNQVYSDQRWSEVVDSFHSPADRDEYREHLRHERKRLAARKIAILILRRERKSLAFRLRKGPRGHQMNYMLDYCTWCLAEKIKEKTGKPDWERVAQLLSDYLPIGTMDANQALKAHRRFAELRNDGEKFMRVIIANGLSNNWFGRDYRTLNKRVRIVGPHNRMGPFSAHWE